MDEATPGAARLRARWPLDVQRDYERWRHSGAVGSVLVSETDRVRVWHLHLPPGTRCAFHRHVLHYFWTALTPGRARGYYGDGRVVEVTHYEGETKHFTYGKGESMVHSVENIGDTDLRFTTVEFLDGPNAPLPVPDGLRLTRAA